MRPAMDRRDFLLLRRRGPKRVVELSCERLYMQWADACSAVGGLDDPDPAGTQSWDGEPATQIATPTPDALLDALGRALRDADVLRLLERQWLSDDAFAAAVDARVDVFRARGGSVE